MICAGRHLATLKVSNNILNELERSQEVRLCAVGDSFIWDEEKTQEDEGCQLEDNACLLYTSPSPRDISTSRMPSSA